MLIILYTLFNLTVAQENQAPRNVGAPCQQEVKCGSMLDLQRKLKERRDQQQQTQTKIPASPAQPQPASQSRG